MSEWASRRKTIYLGVVVFVLSAISFAVFWQFWYQTPTCFDGLKNGGEEGVDCGGPCSLVCERDALQPIIRWDPRIFQISPDVWSTLVYVENPNTNVDATYVPYSFTFYGDGNTILAEREGATILPKNRTVGIFEGSIAIENGNTLRRAVFELGDDMVWTKNNQPAPAVHISHSPILRIESAPRVEASVKNNSLKDLQNIELIVAIFDGSDNVVAASRTFLEILKKNESRNVFFTWPRPFDLGSKVCKQPSDVVLLLDRSGSMTALNVDPPEPLDSVKEAASMFVSQLGQDDKIGVISFATEVNELFEFYLASNFNDAKKAITSVSIKEGSTQYTNISAALYSAWQELLSPRASSEASKITILLTDGIATRPANPESSGEADDVQYAEAAALKTATDAKKDGVVIYTIGLGDDINEFFLKDIASETDNYFFAPSTADLAAIYKNISSRICEEVPARIEITYRVFGDAI